MIINIETRNPWMFMTFLDQIILVLMVLVSIYLVKRHRWAYHVTGDVHWIYYMVSFAILVIAGVLLVLWGYELLSATLVTYIATLIPLGLATGLVTEFYPKFEKAYLSFAIIGLVAIVITRSVIGWGEVLTLSLVHSIAGLTIVVTPIWLSLSKRVNASFNGIAAGGILIGVGGIALACLKMDIPLLNESLIHTILAPLLLLMTVAYAVGFYPHIKRIKAEF